MNQSNIIAAYLFIAFVVFITMRGSLRTYLGFFIGGGAAPVAPGNADGKTAASTTGDNTALASGITNAGFAAFGLPIDTTGLFNIRG